MAKPPLAQLQKQRDSLADDLSRWGRNSDPILRAWHRISPCQTGTVTTKDGREFNPGCLHALCPVCINSVKRRESERAWKAFQRVSRGTLCRAHLSFVTINLVQLPLGSDFRHERDRAKKDMQNFFRRNLNGVHVWGYFDLNPNPDTGMGLLHVHFWMYHPNHARGKIVELLGKDGSGINVKSPQYYRQTIKWNFNRVMWYSMDPALFEHAWSSPNSMRDFIHSYLLLAGKGLMGVRFKFHMGKPRTPSTVILSYPENTQINHANDSDPIQNPSEDMSNGIEEPDSGATHHPNHPGNGPDDPDHLTHSANHSFQPRENP